MRSDNRNYLQNEQYKTSTNLSARINLHFQYSTNPYGWFRWVFDQLDLPAEAHILEIACGRGDLWSENMGRVPETWDITLTDLSEGMLTETRQRLAPGPDALKFAQADVHNIPFADGVFEAVIANHMLYYVRDKPRAFREVLRVLRPDGTFLATTVGERHMQELAALVRRHRAQGERSSFDSTNLDFLLENGRPQLDPFFKHVEMRRYQDTLFVTEAEPLIRYIHSEKVPDALQNREAELRLHIETKIREQGGFTIFKDSGIFIASKGG